MENENVYDFAVSYAGEDRIITNEIVERITEKRFSVYLADRNQYLLLGRDGEIIFEKIFSSSKQVVVFISKYYSQKDWTRYEFDIITKRTSDPKFIPIKLDDTIMKGLPSTNIYLPFTGNNYSEIAKYLIQILLDYEKKSGIHRMSEYDKIYHAIKNESQGALAKAYQLVVDKRTRSPLGDCAFPEENYKIKYEVLKEELFNSPVIKRLSIKIKVPPNLTEDELRYNLKHCSVQYFNKNKPDALVVYAYKGTERFDINEPYTAGRLYFAPWGDWDKAEDGFAYNIPVEEFRDTIDYNKTYYSHYI